jgi:hypothetical protein
MLGNYLFAVSLELARHRRPGVIRFDQAASGGPECLAPRRVAQQPDDREGEVVWRVGGEEVAARFEREAFGANGG